MPKLYQLVCFSRLAPEMSPTCVASIVRATRSLNEARQISSLLVFDGAHFCHYIEGHAVDVTALAERIRADTRHTDFRLLHQAEFEGPPLVAGRSLDYALSYDESLENFEKVRGAEAVHLLKKLLPTLDREP